MALIRVSGARRRTLTASALATGVLALSLGVAADQARAAYTATVQGDTLRITGDGASDKLLLHLRPGAPDVLDVDVGADGTAEFSFDRTTFTKVAVTAGAGNDEVTVSLIGGSVHEESFTIDGGTGNDVLRGGNGSDMIIGGAGNDIVDGNQGDDNLQLGAGADRAVWDPGDGNETVEGRGDADVLEFNGSNIGEIFEVSPNGGRVRFTRNVANIVMDLDDVERLALRTLGGVDNVVVNDMTGTDLATADVDLGAFGGGGDAQADVVTAMGTEGADAVQAGMSSGALRLGGLRTQTRVTGGESSLDVVKASTRGGADVVSSGLGLAGASVFAAEGGEGDDRATFSGGSAADQISLVANGTAARATAPSTVPLEVTTVENLVVQGLAGADTTTATGNLAALTRITMDGGGDNDTLRGGNGSDVIIGGSGNDLADGNQGNDTAFLGAGDDRFQWDPGDGNDTVEGQTNADVLEFNGSNIGEIFEVSPNGGRVRFTRNVANIVMDLDDVERLALRSLGGADQAIVNHLAGTDLKAADVDLQAFAGGGDLEADVVTAVGTNGADSAQVGPIAGGVRVSGLGAQVQVTGSESDRDRVNLRTLGEADAVRTGVGMSGPLAIGVEGGDGADRATFTGTAAPDAIAVVANGTAAHTRVEGSTPLEVTAVEDLVVQGLAGADSISAVGNLAPLTKITMDGGADADVLRGGNGSDVLLGGTGNDTVDGNQANDSALMGVGDDTFVWDPGDGSDVVEGQESRDTLAFNGSNIGEILQASANGGRVLFQRNIANIAMDLDDVERLALQTLGGADEVVIHNMTGTDLATADVNLNSALGGGDGERDTVSTTGTNAPDTVSVARSGAQVRVSGLRTQTQIAGSEAANDTLRVFTLAGDDTVGVAAAARELIAVIADLGDDG